jgi:hypothetical protein
MSFSKKSDVKSHFSPRNNGEVHLFLSVKNQEETHLSEKQDKAASEESVPSSVSIDPTIPEVSALSSDAVLDSGRSQINTQSVER